MCDKGKELKEQKGLFSVAQTALSDILHSHPSTVFK